MTDRGQRKRESEREDEIAIAAVTALSSKEPCCSQMSTIRNAALGLRWLEPERLLRLWSP